MKALILAAGVGKRLSPLTDHAPKCLMDIGNTTPLERMIACLAKIGVREVTVVVGHLKEKIREKLGSRHHGLSIHYVDNDRYQEGSILSLWSTRDFLKDDDFLIMDADVLFPIQALERLASSRHPNAFLLDDRPAPESPTTQGDEGAKDTLEEMKLGARNGRVWEISRKLSGSYEKIGEGMGFLKVSRTSLPSLVALLDEFYRQGRTQGEYEELLNEWIKSETVGYETVRDLSWTEIDFVEDLKKAVTQILPEVEALDRAREIKPLNRRISGWVTRCLLKTRLHPNHITAASFVFGLAGLWLFSRGAYMAGLTGALLFQLFYVLDNCDGEVARAKGLSTRWGGWLDIGCDAVIHSLLFPAVAWGLYRAGGNSAVLWAGLLALAGILTTFLVFMIKRHLKRPTGAFVYLRLGRAQKHKILEYLKAGDFSFLVLAVALLDLWSVFLWVSAAGVHLFWILVLMLGLEERPVG